MSGYELPAQLDTLALAYHLTGDTTKAIELQQRALDLLPVDAPLRQEVEGRLTELQEALERGEGGGERRDGR